MNLDKILNISNVTANSAEIRIYGDIVSSEWDVWEGNEVTPQMIQDHLAQLSGKNIDLYINSAGGSVFAGTQIHNALQRHDGEVTVHIDGVAASIASVIALAGKIVMPENAMMMVHKPLLGYTAGNAKQLRDQAEMLDKVFDAMMTVYEGRLKNPDARESFVTMCDNETWLTAAEVSDLFTDVEVTKANRAVALVSDRVVAQLKKVPASLEVKAESEPVHIDDEPVKPEGGKKMLTIEEIKAAIESGDIKLEDIKALAVKDGERIVEAKSVNLVEALGEYKTVEAIETLKSEAEHGRKYMADLIDAAVAERVKAQGELFSQDAADKYKVMLARMGDIDMIKDEIELYKKQVESQFAPGRQIQTDETKAKMRESVLLKKGDK